jgi:hypothetical protein
MVWRSAVRDGSEIQSSSLQNLKLIIQWMLSPIVMKIHLAETISPFFPFCGSDKEAMWSVRGT